MAETEQDTRQQLRRWSLRVLVLAALVADAEKAGWTRKVSTHSFRSQPDAFAANSLPKPGGAVKPSAKASAKARR